MLSCINSDFVRVYYTVHTNRLRRLMLSMILLDIPVYCLLFTSHPPSRHASGYIAQVLRITWVPCSRLAGGSVYHVALDAHCTD